MERIALVVLCLCLCAGLCGCDLWMQGSYAHVSPHKMPDSADEGERIEVSSFHTLYLAMGALVEDGVTAATIYYPNENQQTVESYMESAVQQIRNGNPIGSYAVKTITYEVGTRGGVQAVALEILYDRSLSDIRYIKRVTEVQEGEALIYEALNNCSSSATFFVEKYAQTDLIQLIKNHVDENPDICMEMPQVTVTTYPKDGPSRVVEVLFAYENSRDDLRAMQQTVAAAFDSAMLSVSQDAGNLEKCGQIYRFLMLHYNSSSLNTSITPAYSLLHYNVGDSKAYATVYAAMCRKVGVDCKIVVGTKDGKPYYWNAVLESGEYLFTDLLQCARHGGFFLSTKEQMRDYVWDYSAFDSEEESDESQEPS